jgi:mRNA interferase HigB
MVRRRPFSTSHEVKDLFGTASMLCNGLVVFNIGGNKYRLVVHMRYDLGIAFIKEVMTHAEYDVWTKMREK